MRLIVTGSLSFDHVMSMPGRFKDYLMPEKLHIINVSFLMDTFRLDKGGTAGNQAYSLALLGLKPILLGSAGKDFFEYKRHLDKAGVNTSRIKMYRKQVTATGFAMTDKNNNQVWGFYSGAMKEDAHLSLLDKAKENDFVVLAPTDPRAMEKYVDECCQIKCRFLFDPAFQTPRLKINKLKKGALKAKIVIGNDYEIALLLKRLKLAKRQLLKPGKILITTLGSKGSIIETKEARYKIPIAKPDNSSDPTGAGDAYRAGFLAGYLRGLSLPESGRMGSLAATYSVEKSGTQTHKFSLSSFKRRYKINFNHELRY